MAHNSIAGFEASSALRKLHAVGVPVNFRLRGPELAYVVEDSGARVVCAGPEFVEHVEAARAQLRGEPVLVALGGEAPAGWRRMADLVAGQPADPLPEDPDQEGLGRSMTYASGTPGRPKGALRANGLSPEAVLRTIQMFTLAPSDVHLMAGPGYHSAVAAFSSLTSLCGGTVVMMPRFDPAE